MTNQLKDGRWKPKSVLIKMTWKRKNFDLVQAQQEAPVKKKQVNVSSNELVVVRKRDWISEVKRYEEAMNELDDFID